jgi:peptide/nickel transport system ATP-binding protein
LSLSEREMRDIRWNEISMIPQTAMNALNPVYTVADQFAEVITHHQDKSKAEAIERGKELFELVDLDPNRIDNYPHQFSGGMLQRVMIAMSLALDPSVILADEPTTALDVIVQDAILNRIEALQDELDFSILLITHDISVVSEMCDEIAVMYGGRVMEKGRTRDIIKEPLHPYTMGLRNAFPSIETDSETLISIPGTPPSLIDPEDECRFAHRCPFAEEECYAGVPAVETYENDHRVECVRSDEAEFLRNESSSHTVWQDLRERISQ